MIKMIEQYLNRYNNDVKEIMTGVELQNSKESNQSKNMFINQSIDIANAKKDELRGVIIGYNFLADNKVQLEKIEVLGGREDRIGDSIIKEEIYTYSIANCIK